MKRCAWVTTDQIYIDYHDREWGVPVYDDFKLFEMLILEGAQAGLSWITVLKKRENYRSALDGFDYYKVSSYNEEKIEELLHNEGLIRNERKLRSTVQNAVQFINLQKEYGSFSNYIWNYVDGKPIINHWNDNKQIPTETDLSRAISKDLKKRGFNFVGPTIIYSYLQAVGIVNDHLITCFCHPNFKESK